MTVRFSSLHTVRPPMTEARRQQVHGSLQGWSEIIANRQPGEPHPVVGALLLFAMLVLLGLGGTAFFMMIGAI